MTGIFLSFEGGDGSGKTTQVAEFVRRLERKGLPVLAAREPGGTELGRDIRKLVLHGSDVSDRAEALLYAADRAHHVATVVRPGLESGKIVVTDRYLDSSVAYQGVARKLGPEEVRDLSLWATEGLMPDLTVLLDVSVASGGARVGANQDRIESAGTAFHEAVRQEYLTMAKAQPNRWVVVSAEGSIEEVAARVERIVVPRLEELMASTKLRQNDVVVNVPVKGQA